MIGLILLAAIQVAPNSGPANPSAPSGAAATPVPPQDLIKDIAPPVSLPIPPWQWALIMLGALILCAALVWAVWWIMKEQKAPPPTPRSIALRDLDNLRGRFRTMEPYAFSIAVSDVLRTFIGGQYGLHAREQTSPEFLAAIGTNSAFSSEDHRLLATFLEQCDLIKFARVSADEQVNEQLLSAAAQFVQGGRE